MTKWYHWVILLTGVGAWLGAFMLGSHLVIQPYNGDIMASKIPDQCAHVFIKYLGPATSATTRRGVQLSLDTYHAMQLEYAKCRSEALTAR